MQLSKIKIRDFQGVQRAEVGFEPGVNVLFGPNDLGKSTLANAIRAALVIPSTSAAAEAFVPWHKDASPWVELTFRGPRDRTYRVTKTFSRTRGAAELYTSADGVSFNTTCKGREVDGKLREILQWGLAAPGGRTGRKLPRSFLTQVLFAEQTDVTAILAQTLEDDPGPSGRLRLTEALGALAQDPVFKGVLDRAQQERDRYFTATGRKRGGSGSPFTTARNQVVQAQEQVDVLRTRLADSELAEARIRELLEAEVLATEAKQLALDEHTELARMAELGAAYRQGEERVAQALARVTELDQIAARIAEMETEVAGAASAVVETTGALEKARSDEADARRKHEAARDALRDAQSEDGAQARAVRKGELTTALAELRIERVEGVSQAELAGRASSADGQIKSARTELEQMVTLAEQLAKQLDEAGSQTAELERQVNEVRSLEAFQKWRDAGAKLATAEAKAAQINGLDRELRGRVERAAHHRRVADATGAPGREVIDRLRALERQLETAEASLGGGFAIRVTRNNSLDVTASLDGAAVAAVPTGELMEVDREATIAVGELVDIEIVAGEAHARDAAQALRALWQREGAPLLATAGVTEVAGLAVLQRTADEHRNDAARSEALGEANRTQLAALRQDAPAVEALRAAVDALSAGLPQADRARLEERYDELGLGAGTGTLTERRDTLGERLRDARQGQGDLERQKAQAEAKSQAVHKALGAARAARLALDVDDARVMADAAATRIAETDARLAALEAELQRLDESANQAVSIAEGGVAKALGVLEDQSERVQGLRDALSKQQLRAGEADGILKSLREQLANGDRAGHAKIHAEERAALAELTKPEREVTQQDREQVGQRAQSATAQLRVLTAERNQAEGALAMTGGQPVREAFANAERQLHRARKHQSDGEIEAQSWQVLLDTLREVETTEGAHLGKALAGPVGEKLGALTRGRYRSIRLGKDLNCLELAIPGVGDVADVVGKLSVGTRDQLATLLRLSIAKAINSTIILDDHLVHADPERMTWFVAALEGFAEEGQAVVITCRPDDYQGPGIRKVDMTEAIVRWRPEDRGAGPDTNRTAGS